MKSSDLHDALLDETGRLRYRTSQLRTMAQCIGIDTGNLGRDKVAAKLNDALNIDPGLVDSAVAAIEEPPIQQCSKEGD